jgi:hypothetical protein
MKKLNKKSKECWLKKKNFIMKNPLNILPSNHQELDAHIKAKDDERNTICMEERGRTQRF